MPHYLGATANPTADALQAAASRFATVAGFSPLVPTSQFDDQTLQAIRSALGWIAVQVPTEADTAHGLLTSVVDTSTMTNSASGLTTYLNQIGDQANVGGSNLNFTPGAMPAGGGFLGLGLPNWIFYLAGAAVVVGVGAVLIKHHASEMAGLAHGYDDGNYDNYDDDIEDAEFTDAA
jgi:hypothetical protein